MRHLFAATEYHQPSVGPVPRKRLLVRQRLGLSDLVLVMRKDQVRPTTVDVDLIAKRLAHHGRALDVPARPAATPRAGPRRLAFASPLPQCKVARVAFARLELFACRPHRAVPGAL